MRKNENLSRLKMLGESDQPVAGLQVKLQLSSAVTEQAGSCCNTPLQNFLCSQAGTGWGQFCTCDTGRPYVPASLRFLSGGPWCRLVLEEGPRGTHTPSSSRAPGRPRRAVKERVPNLSPEGACIRMGIQDADS